MDLEQRKCVSKRANPWCKKSASENVRGRDANDAGYSVRVPGCVASNL